VIVIRGIGYSSRASRYFIVTSASRAESASSDSTRRAAVTFSVAVAVARAI
jgi:hypothetical protein